MELRGWAKGWKGGRCVNCLVQLVGIEVEDVVLCESCQRDEDAGWPPFPEDVTR